MSCRVWEEIAGAAVDTALDRDSARELEAHVLLCRACAERREELADLRTLLAGTGRDDRFEMPPPVEREIFARVAADRSSALVRLARVVAARIALPRLLPSTATAACLLAVCLAGWIGEPPDTAVPAPAAPGKSLYDPPSAPAPPAGAEASLLTVWDSRAERIVTTFDPTGLAGAGRDAVERVALHPPAPPVYGAVVLEPPAEVHIFLFEKIVVRG